MLKSNNNVSNYNNEINDIDKNANKNNVINKFINEKILIHYYQIHHLINLSCIFYNYNFFNHSRSFINTKFI